MYSLGHQRHEMQYTMFSDLQAKHSRMVVELLGPHGVRCVHASAAAGMSTCENSWFFCLGPARGVYLDISQGEIVMMCTYRWSGEDCCSRKVCHQDVEVVKQNVFSARSQGVV